MRGNITKRGKASWQLKFDVGAVNGKRQTRYATVRGTHKDAQKELTRLLKAADDALYRAKSEGRNRLAIGSSSA